MPESHQNYLLGFRDNLDVMRTCVAHNHEIIKLMLQEAEVMFENKNHTIVNVSGPVWWREKEKNKKKIKKMCD